MQRMCHCTWAMAVLRSSAGCGGGCEVTHRVGHQAQGGLPSIRAVRAAAVSAAANSNVSLLLILLSGSCIAMQVGAHSHGCDWISGWWQEACQ
jgi:hypothetical protein